MQEQQHTIERVLTEKITSLEGQLAAAERVIHELSGERLQHAIPWLRLEGVALVYFGEQHGSFGDLQAYLTQRFGERVSTAVMQHVFLLDRVPLADSERETMRTALSGSPRS